MESTQLDALLAEIVDLERMLEERAKHFGFNIFEVLGIVSSETRHSNMIAWLMDPNAKHGLGGGVLAGLLELSGVTPPADLSGFSVRRETRHIDILATSQRDHIVLAIENKVWSGEHDDQLARYQHVVESTYPGWKHVFIFLTPHADDPENSEDAETWNAMGYGDLADVVQESLNSTNPAAKARVFIKDYIDCVRRRIVGDEELAERCVEIYRKHKRAIDLIMENLPDTAKTVHDYAREWAEGAEGLYVVRNCSGGKQYVRFRTGRLDSLFPELEEADSWGQHSFWFYEIISSGTSDGLGCSLKIQLCFNHPKKANVPKSRRKQMVSFVKAFAGGEERVFETNSYSGYFSESIRFDPSSAEYANVADACEEFWREFRDRESCAIREVFGG